MTNTVVILIIAGIIGFQTFAGYRGNKYLGLHPTYPVYRNRLLSLFKRNSNFLSQRYLNTSCWHTFLGHDLRKSQQSKTVEA